MTGKLNGALQVSPSLPQKGVGVQPQISMISELFYDQCVRGGPHDWTND